MRIPLDCTLTPERVLLALRDEPWPFALTGRWAGGGAIVGSAPRALLAPDDDPFARLEDLPPARGDAEVGGGWFGWLGYGLGALVETLPPPPPRPVSAPRRAPRLLRQRPAPGRRGPLVVRGARRSARPARARSTRRRPARSARARPQAARRRPRAGRSCARRVHAARARRGGPHRRRGRVRRAHRRRGDLPGQPLPAARRVLPARRSSSSSRTPRRSCSRPTARASSRPGAASPASRPSSSCAVAVAT